MKKTLLLISLASLITLISLIILTVLSSRRDQQTSPLSPNPQTNLNPKRLLGFLPYWQLESVDRSRLATLSDVVYFGVHFDENGNLAVKDSDGNREQGYSRLAKADKTIPRMSLAVVLQDNEKIETFLKNDAAQTRLIENVRQLIAQYALTGINLDVEYSGIPGKETVAAYSVFVERFTKTIKQHHPNITVSVDVTADSIKKSRLYDVENLAKYVDMVILMGYDFHRPGSSVAGPVAPLTGKELYEYDVTTAVRDFLTVVPAEKLILGVPYYGWDFPTVNEDRGSFVEKRPDEGVALSTYKRNRRLIEENSLAVKFDNESQTPWMIYKDPDTGGIRQVWFENEVSLEKKYDLVNREDLAGIAIWALGYDGNYPDLWKLLEEKFKR